jgi:hypothetical protein
MLYLVAALVALAFVALVACGALVVRDFQGQLAEVREVLVKHQTRIGRALAAQLVRDREEQHRHVDAAAAVIVAQLAPQLTSQGGRVAAPLGMRSASPAGAPRSPLQSSAVVGAPGALGFVDDDATPPSGFTLDQIRAHVAQLETGDTEPAHAASDAGRERAHTGEA